MQIDYEILSSISVDPKSRNTLVNHTSKVLASYLQLLSNMIYANEKITESELAMIVASLNRWITKKEYINQQPYGVGKIVQLDWGANFSPELSYKHPALIIEEWKNTIFVIPATSTPSILASAYHPTDNPNGKWYYRKVGKSEGFAHDCTLILNNAKVMSKTRIISISGSLLGDLNNENNVFREIRRTMLRHFFSKEWNEYQKILQNYKDEQNRNAELQNTCTKLLEEIERLKLEIIVDKSPQTS